VAARVWRDAVTWRDVTWRDQKYRDMTQRDVTWCDAVTSHGCCHPWTRILRRIQWTRKSLQRAPTSSFVATGYLWLGHLLLGTHVAWTHVAWTPLTRIAWPPMSLRVAATSSRHCLDTCGLVGLWLGHLWLGHVWLTTVARTPIAWTRRAL